MNLLPRQLGFFDEAAADASIPEIAGLSFIPNFITPETEAALLEIIDAQPWLTDLKRRVQHYGYRYDYKARNVTPDLRLGEVPDWLMPYCRKLHEARYFEQLPDQVIINEYQPGQGIAPHVDCVPCFGATIASISLGSPCVMDFTHSKTAEKTSLLLEPRSLLVMTGDARYLWQHGIAPRKTDCYHGQTIQRIRRVSMTFRTMILAG